ELAADVSLDRQQDPSARLHLRPGADAEFAVATDAPPEGAGPEPAADVRVLGGHSRDLGDLPQETGPASSDARSCPLDTQPRARATARPPRPPSLPLNQTDSHRAGHTRCARITPCTTGSSVDFALDNL